MKMELELVRTYFPNGTNGEFLLSNKRVCSSIELAWLDNKHGVSCIPEGRYELVKRYSKKFGWHLLLKDVPDISLILIHPANDAVKVLRGCIAPVSVLKAEGKGLQSRKAFDKIIALATNAFDQSKQVFLTIKS